jgi:hypothetical protein
MWFFGAIGLSVFQLFYIYSVWGVSVNLHSCFFRIFCRGNLIFEASYFYWNFYFDNHLISNCGFLLLVYINSISEFHCDNSMHKAPSLLSLLCQTLFCGFHYAIFTWMCKLLYESLHSSVHHSHFPSTLPLIPSLSFILVSRYYHHHPHGKNRFYYIRAKTWYLAFWSYLCQSDSQQFHPFSCK